MICNVNVQPRQLRYTVLALCVFGLAASATAQTATQQRTFTSPDEAVTALMQAAKKGDQAGARAILGKGAQLSSGDTVADRVAAERFAARFDKKNAIVPDGDSRAKLTVDADDWPFAFPLVKTDKGWRFDTETGNQELLARRIGDNELAAMKVMLAIVDAQREYAAEDRDGDGSLEYAPKFASTAGKKDGLFWRTKAGEPPSPLGDLVARAAGQGYKKETGPQPYYGYYYRFLSGQSANAKGGAYDYTVKGRTIGGFAVIAYPAKYANSGVMTFMVNHDGVVYEKDLGPDTANVARAISRFDPSSDWKASSVK